MVYDGYSDVHGCYGVYNNGQRAAGIAGPFENINSSSGGQQPRVFRLWKQAEDDA